jgi:hypothetical protein
MKHKFQKQSTLKFKCRIIQKLNAFGNYPRGKTERDKWGSNSPPLGVYFTFDTLLLEAG